MENRGPSALPGDKSDVNPLDDNNKIWRVVTIKNDLLQYTLNSFEQDRYQIIQIESLKEGAEYTIIGRKRVKFSSSANAYIEKQD